MTIEAVAAVFHHSQATPTAKLVLSAIAWHASEEMTCWPSQETLGHYANITSRQVRRALEQLVEIGELEIWKHKGPKTGNTPAPNLYFLVLECPAGCDRTLQHRPLLEDKIGTTTGQNWYDNRTKLAKTHTKNVLLNNIETTTNNKKFLKAI